MKYADKLTDFCPAHANLPSTLADARMLSQGEARRRWSYLPELLAAQQPPSLLALRLPALGQLWCCVCWTE